LSRGWAHAPTHRYYPPILPILYPHLKNKTHPLPNHFCSSQNSRHANKGTSIQGGFYHQPNRRPQTHRPNLSPNGQLLRNRTTLAHLSSTRAQGGPTLPTIRRRSRGAPPCAPTRPTQNPQTPTHPNRPRHRAAPAPTPPVRA